MNKKLYLEILRIIAIGMVIFNHTDGFFLYFSETDHVFTYLFSIILSAVCRIAVPLFFMVSGALLLGKKETIREVFQKRIIRISIILIVFSFFYYILDVIRIPEMNFNLLVFGQKLLSKQVMESFWFLYAYLGMLILLPFLRIIAEGMTRELFYYLVLLKILFSVLLGIVTLFFGYSLGSNLFVLEVSVYYLLIGYGLENFFEDKHYTSYGMILSGAITVLCAVLVILLQEWQKNRTGIYQRDILDIFVPILTLKFWYAAKYICNKNIWKEYGKKLIFTLGECTFLVYLIEKAVRIQLLPIYLYLCEHTVGVAACSAYILGSLFLAYAYAILLRKIPLIRKYI